MTPLRLRSWIVVLLAACGILAISGCKAEDLVLRPEDLGLKGPHQDTHFLAISFDGDPVFLRVDSPDAAPGTSPPTVQVRRDRLYHLSRDGGLHSISPSDIRQGDSLRVWFDVPDDSGRAAAVAVVE